jgi:hypothetical protein
MNETNHRYQRLATSVLTQAIVDLTSKIKKTRNSAHRFLYEDGDRTCLEHWAQQAGLEPTEVIRLLKRTTPEELRKSLDSERVRRF